MRTLRTMKRIGLILLLLFWPTPAFTDIVVDGSFETPDLATNSFAYNPVGSAWTFTQSAGIIDAPSAFDAPIPPDGSQLGFLQSDSNPAGFGEFSQTISLATPGRYRLTYFDAGRLTAATLYGTIAFGMETVANGAPEGNPSDVL